MISGGKLSLNSNFGMKLPPSTTPVDHLLAHSRTLSGVRSHSARYSSLQNLTTSDSFLQRQPLSGMHAGATSVLLGPDSDTGVIFGLKFMVQPIAGAFCRSRYKKNLIFNN